jgi:hypothetical protein
MILSSVAAACCLLNYCCRWIDRVFLPAINQAGTDGWDIVRIANAIKDRAHSTGDEVGALSLHHASPPGPAQLQACCAVVSRLLRCAVQLSTPNVYYISTSGYEYSSQGSRCSSYGLLGVVAVCCCRRVLLLPRLCWGSGVPAATPGSGFTPRGGAWWWSGQEVSLPSPLWRNILGSCTPVRAAEKFTA